MSLDALFRSMRDEAEDDGPPDISTMGKVEILKDFASRYIEFLSLPCPFKPGDFVTPRKDAPIKGKGEPNVVLETQPNDLRWDDEPGSSAHGLRPDMRVVRRDRSGYFVVVWAESVHFERWTEEA